MDKLDSTFKSCLDKTLLEFEFKFLIDKLSKMEKEFENFKYLVKAMRNSQNQLYMDIEKGKKINIIDNAKNLTYQKKVDKILKNY